jgi:hypothetical protein
MIKRVIGIATILLVILGIGILVTKASPLVNRVETVNRVELVGNNTVGLSVVNGRLELADMLERQVVVNLKNVKVLKDTFRGHVGGELPNRLARNELNTMRGVLVDLHDGLDANSGGNHFDLDNSRNVDGAAVHLKDNLANYTLGTRVPSQVKNVLPGLHPNFFQKVSLFETVEESLKESKVAETLAVLNRTAVELSSVKTLEHGAVATANPLVDVETVNVTENFGERALGVDHNVDFLHS